MGKWVKFECKCGKSDSYNEDWSNPPSLCRECREERKKAKENKSTEGWFYKECEWCGKKNIPIRLEWDRPPRVCNECKELASDTFRCEQCGERVHYWKMDKKPRFCKDHRKKTIYCKHCRNPLIINSEWENPPQYHKECAWDEKTMCLVCEKPLRIHRSWEYPPKCHKECLAGFYQKTLRCVDCGDPFDISAVKQAQLAKAGKYLPPRCFNCSKDKLLIRGAVGSLSEEQKKRLTVKIEPGGLFHPEKEITVVDKRTGKQVAEIQMRDEGVFVNKRTAVVVNSMGDDVSKTRVSTRGIFTERHVAETKSVTTKEVTHITEDKDKGIFQPKFVTETTSVSDKSSPPMTVFSVFKGWLLRDRTLETKPGKTK